MSLSACTSWDQAKELYARQSDDLIGTTLAKKVNAASYDKFEIAVVTILALAAILVVVFTVKNPDATYLGALVGSIGGAAALYIGYRLYSIYCARQEMRDDDANGDKILAKTLTATIKEIEKKRAKLLEQEGNSSDKLLSYNALAPKV